ncbi:MAG: hypothetical protein RBS55_11320 [Bacteroidales bacterium]|jgi:hypothetical protein|nr:hypothetical protein [Bacteroidales bacterium]
MKTYYQEILKSFRDDEEIKKAALDGNALIYKYLSWMIMQNSTLYRTLSIKNGTAEADRLLMDALVIFRRQLNHNHFRIVTEKERIFISRKKTPLAEHLAGLFDLMTEISPLNTFHNEAQTYLSELAGGRAIGKLYALRPRIFSALHKAGCTKSEDKEDLLNETMVIFWQKLTGNEIGIYLHGKKDNPDHCFVFGKQLCQQSKLSTFLAGIAINRFMNMTRTAEFKAIKSDPGSIPEFDYDEEIFADRGNPTEALYHYYRERVEPRKIRTLVSMLQYDCCLDEKYVKELIGINNARIHSCRQRESFCKWQQEPANRTAGLLDDSNDYLADREKQAGRLNEKIRIIDRAVRENTDHADLEKFSEEFRSESDFNRYCRLFKEVFYLSASGKPSRFTGLADEQELRSRLDAFKKVMLTLPSLKAIQVYVFYGAEEPHGSHVSLLRSLSPELAEMQPSSETLNRLIDQMNERLPSDPAELADDIYVANRSLFTKLSTDINFANLVN